MITNNVTNNYHALLSTGFKAHSTADVPTVTGDETLYTLLLDTVDYDIGSDYNVATGIFTVPSTGYYLVRCACKIYNITLGAAAAGINIRMSIGGILTPIFCPSTSAETSGTMTMNYSLLLHFNASDTISAVIAGGVGAKVLGVAAGSSFDITYIGA